MKFGPQSQRLGCVGLWQKHPAKSASAWWNKTMCNVNVKYSITWGETKGLLNHVDGVISKHAQFTWSRKVSEKCCEWFHQVNGLLSWRWKGTTCSKHQKKMETILVLNESPAKCSSELQPALPAAILKALRKACGMRKRTGNLLRLFKVNPRNLTSDDWFWLILIEYITWARDGKMGNL